MSDQPDHPGGTTKGASGFAGALGDLRGRALVAVLGCFACQLAIGFGYTFSPLMRFVIEDLDWSRAEWASAVSPRIFVIAMASPIIGALVVRLGARAILMAALVVLAACSFGLSRVQSVGELLAWNLVLGLALVGVGDVVVGHVAVKWVRERRGLALGLIYIGSNLAGMFLVPLAAEIAADTSWRDAWQTIGLGLAVCLFPFALFAVREPRPGELSAIDETAAEAEDESRSLALSQAIRTRSFWILGFVLFSYFAFFMTITDHLITFLMDVGLDRSSAASALTKALGMGLIAKLAYGFIADHVSAKTGAILNTAVFLISSLLCLALPGEPWLGLFILTYGFAAAARDVVYPLIVVYCFGPKYLAQIYGALSVMLLLGGSPGSILAGLASDQFGSYQPAFMVFATLNALSLALLFLVRREGSRN